MKTAFLFPGQGAQTVGMGQDFADAFPACAQLFEKANQIVGYDLSSICFNGPQEKLNSTTVSQPAIFVISAVILDRLRSDTATADIIPDVTAGLSMGEYTALYAAGAIGFEDALVLVQKRGKAMQAAAEASNGSMVSVIGLDEEKVDQLCLQAVVQDGFLLPVNFNCPGQIVISGDIDSCRIAADLAPQFGAIKAVILKVAGAFHTDAMTPAANLLKDALETAGITQPSNVKIIANIDADYYNGPEYIRQGLIKQLVQPILWQKCMQKLLADGVENFYEIGPSRVLTGLMKRIDRKIKVINISDVKSIDALKAKASVETK